jgi:saccharopine dehydrogenase-like NADP-dependent oxidoreductase
MKILLIGAGAVSSVLAKLLADDQSVSKIVCTSRDTKRAKEFIGAGNRKIKIVALNTSDGKAINRIAKGSNLIVNVSLPRFNETVMEAALKVGAHYQDLASELADQRTAEQLKFHERFRHAGCVALINCGISPGVTNLLAREAADELDKTETIHFRSLEEQKASELILAWSAETMLDELTTPPLVYKNKRFASTKPFDNPEEYEFPHPFGKRQVFSIYGDEVATIPLFLNVKNVDYKIAGADIDLSKVLYRLNLFNKKPVLYGNKKIIPVDFFRRIAPKVPTPKEMSKMIKNGSVENAVYFSAIETIGKKGKNNIKITMSAAFPDLKSIPQKFSGSTYISYPTGVAAYAFFKALNQIKSSGVFPPEALSREARNVVILELTKKGIVINERIQKV